MVKSPNEDLMRPLIIFVVLALLATPAGAFPAIVTSVHDGDTVTLKTAEGQAHCRLAGIDAPETMLRGRWTDQPSAYEARAALSDMVIGQTVDVEDTGQRSYKRMVCRITAVIDGRSVDVNEAMVSQGWAYSAIQFEPAHDRDPAIPALQAQAQSAHIGIWAGTPVEPWVWRRDLR
jgi:micrococcal nuclease